MSSFGPGPQRAVFLDIKFWIKFSLFFYNLEGAAP
jgi:hypothetical protein